MAYDYKTFRKFFEDRRKILLARDVSNIDIGVKFLEISRAIISEWLAADTLEQSWEVIEYKLPKDYSIVPWGTDLTIQAISCGTYSDNVLLLIGSKTFPKVAEGEQIPTLNIHISPDDMIWVHRTQWYWVVYKWIARPFINRFPRWVRL